MSKRKRNISQAQRDKLAIETAKILKRKGILSKQTKLHGGKYISRSVLKKTIEYQSYAAPGYTALPVKKDVAKAAKAEGYVVSNGRIIAPRDHDFIKRIKAGALSGVKPVPGGTMAEITIPFTARNMRELVDMIESGNLDALKLPSEMYAFSIGDNMSFRAFGSVREMRNKFLEYNPEINISAIKLFRMHPDDQADFIPSLRQRKLMYKQRQRSPESIARSNQRRSERLERMARLFPARYELMMKAKREKSAKKYARVKADPAKYEATLKRGRERARKSHQNRKDKP